MLTNCIESTEIWHVSADMFFRGFIGLQRLAYETDQHLFIAMFLLNQPNNVVFPSAQNMIRIRIATQNKFPKQ
jgi:hypothetical protein